MLEELKQSISDMSDDDLLTLVKDIRANRRAAPAAMKKKKAQSTTEKFLNGLSLEQLEELLQKLEN